VTSARAAVKPLARTGRPDAPMPLYFRILSVLESRIHSGHYPPGSLLGTEKELALEFAVSRITIHRAMEMLSRKGLVDQQRARGTFVSPEVQPRGRVELHGFLDDVMVMGTLGETREVEYAEIGACDAVARRLEVRPGTVVSRVLRLRVNSGVQNTWAVDYMPLDIGRRFDVAQLRTQSIIQLVDQQSDLRLERGNQLISAQPADAEVAARFGVAEGTPILLVERELQASSGRTAAYSRFYYLGHPQWVRVSRVGR
jgi:GntR family transcriptional regulator